MTTPSAPRFTTPGDAWRSLMAGNERFVADTMVQPARTAAQRESLSASQAPYAVVLGCSDSRVAAEFVFDQGLGDLFVVRTAGHVLDTTVIGSIEYAISQFGTPLVVVLGHDRCGAVGAAMEALTTGRMPTGFVRAVVDRVIPSLVTTASLPSDPGAAAGSVPAVRAGLDGHTVQLPGPDEVRREHVRTTVEMLVDYSAALRERIAEGTCAVAGVEYTLAEGTARLVDSVGDLT